MTEQAGVGDVPIPGAIDPEALGTASLEPRGEFVAGSYQTFTLIYRAGPHGIDDSGSIRVCFRFATDQGRLQFEEPAAPNYATVVASNNARLEYRFDYKGNVRPWDRTLHVKVVDGFLREGDTIQIRMGVTDHGSRGLRLQTFCEDTFEFRVLVDPIATFNFQPLREQPTIRIVPGEPVRYLAVVPTLWGRARPFSLRLKAEDRWGNPTAGADARCVVTSECLAGGRRTVQWIAGQRTTRIDGLSIDELGEYHLLVHREDGELLCRSNPIRIDDGSSRHAWADLHGQSEETIGTNSADAFFTFARDLAFLDAAAHQGNDFQIATPFWSELNRLCAKFDERDRFVVLPGYEWSGNTGLGGDRNVYFPDEGRTLRRSSHALVVDKSDADTDCRHANDLFDALADNGEWDVVVFAHCGGRYADIRAAHDGRFEKSVEIHSSWGTFEWILEDAFERGYRVGIVANSDGHKGRPGASYPGASLFGAIGGLTCLFVERLTREDVLDCLRKRHHFGTTGGPNGRMLFDVTATFSRTATLFHDDPAVIANPGAPSDTAMMGDIVHLPHGEMQVLVSVAAGCPIERIDLFNGTELLQTVRPHHGMQTGRRVRLVWCGARYRGRFRQVTWDGEARAHGNRIQSARPINFFNADKQPVLEGDGTVRWQSLTTGNIAGIELVLEKPSEGSLDVVAGPISFTVRPGALAEDDVVHEIPGPLPRYVRVCAMPDDPGPEQFEFTRPIELATGRDNPIYARVTLDDGTQAWSSPVYVFR